MSIEPTSEGDNVEQDADRQADAMKAQLRKDVDSWSKARSEAHPARSAEPSVPVDRPAPPKPAPRAKKVDPTPSAPKTANTVSKPFSMSYGGETTKAYMEYMISRGVR
jgi:hypothetical protein